MGYEPGNRHWRAKTKEEQDALELVDYIGRQESTRIRTLEALFRSTYEVLTRDQQITINQKARDLKATIVIDNGLARVVLDS